MNNSNCSKHKVPEYLQDLEKVATDLADMPYDKLVEFFDHLQKKLSKDSDRDHELGHYRLSILLSNSYLNVIELRDTFKKIWNLCEKYMK